MSMSFSIEDISSNGLLPHLLSKVKPPDLAKLCKVTDNKIMVWKDLIIIFVIGFCGLAISMIGLIQ